MNQAPKSILVRAPNWIGDQVLAYPFFYYLRCAFPKAHITSVCVPWVEDLQFRDLVNEVVVLPRVLKEGWRDRFSGLETTSRKLKQMRSWDLGISLPNSLSAAWLIFRAGAKKRRGYKVDGRALLLNDGLKWDPSSRMHRAQAYVELLPEAERPARPAKEFWGIPPANDLESRISGELNQFNPRRSWPTADVLEPPEGPYWVLGPGSTAVSRRWPEEYFTVLARQISDQTGWPGIIVGGAKEAPIAARLCEDRSLRLKDWTARGSITSLSKIFSQAKITVCNESGLAHVASLCGSPVQIICGAADPRRTEPIGPGKIRVMVNPVDCWPCERNTCSQPPELQLQCLKGIRPDAVWEEMKRAIRT